MRSYSFSPPFSCLDNSSKSINQINNDSKVNEISLINRISIYPRGILIPSITYF